jgi:hypothetical protein
MLPARRLYFHLPLLFEYYFNRALMQSCFVYCYADLLSGVKIALESWILPMMLSASSLTHCGALNA